MKCSKRVDIVKIQLVKESSVKYVNRIIDNPESANEFIRSFVGNPDREEFGVLCIDTKGQPTHISKVAIGDLNRTIVHPREIFKIAILSNAAGVILFHNHPSGKENPSEEDKAVTKRLCEAGELLGIRVIDHIILGALNVFSFRNKDLI